MFVVMCYYPFEYGRMGFLLEPIRDSVAGRKHTLQEFECFKIEISCLGPGWTCSAFLETT